MKQTGAYDVCLRFFVLLFFCVFHYPVVFLDYLTEKSDYSTEISDYPTEISDYLAEKLKDLTEKPNDLKVLRDYPIEKLNDPAIRSPLSLRKSILLFICNK